jgi:hypothetical protein
MNIPFTLALVFAIFAVSLHVFTFEHWIWPKLTSDSFPTTPFTDKDGTKLYYRFVWHYFTVMFLMTIGSLIALLFVDGFAAKHIVLAKFLGIQWFGILLMTLLLTYISLKPGQSFIRTLIVSWQWILMVLLGALMFWGASAYS